MNMKLYQAPLIMGFIFGFCCAALGQGELPAVSSGRAANPEEAREAIASGQPTNVAQAQRSRYEHERMARYRSNGKALEPKDIDALEAVLNEWRDNAPTTASLAWAEWLHYDFSKAAFDRLVAAQNAAPDLDPATEALTRMAAAELYRQPELRDNAVATIQDLELFSSANHQYHRNLLAAVDPGGVVLTNGEGDTYPLLIAAYSNRPDVTVVQLDWLRESGYRSYVCELLKIPAKKRTDNPSEFLDMALHHTADRPLYLALTLPPPMLKTHRKDLWPVGNVMLHQKAAEQANISRTVVWWENQANRETMGTNDPINVNYLIPLSLLNNHYMKTGQTHRAQVVQEWLKMLAKQPDHDRAARRVTTY